MEDHWEGVWLREAGGFNRRLQKDKQHLKNEPKADALSERRRRPKPLMVVSAN
jgi:hypothetical protein